MYSALVEEVLELAKSGPLLSVPRLEYPGVILVHSIEEAKRLATDQFYDADMHDWTDIRSHEIGKINGEGYRTVGFAEVRKSVQPLFQLLKRYLNERPGLEDDVVSNEVLSDLYHCLIARGLHGKQESFIEKMYEIYSAGGWPCGWNGDYPKTGCMFVYFNRVSLS